MAIPTEKLPFKLKTGLFTIRGIQTLPCKYVVVWWYRGKASTRYKLSCHRNSYTASARMRETRTKDKAAAKAAGARTGRGTSEVQYAAFRVDSGTKLKDRTTTKKR